MVITDYIVSMSLDSRISAFVELGVFLSNYLEQKSDIVDTWLGAGSYAEFDRAVSQSLEANPWFTRPFVFKAIYSIVEEMLNPDKLAKWLTAYPQLGETRSRRIGIIMAGNIPLVGFHDLLCVLLSGHFAVIKPSSKDGVLIKAVCVVLGKIAPQLNNNFEFSARTLHGIDALIATGSNNSARYFESGYSGLPRLIRKNRYSVAVLSGNETNEQLCLLSNDIFDYFGLGCRNVSNLLVPEGYDFAPLLEVLECRASIMEHSYYADCYRYWRAVLTLDDTPFIDNGFVLLREQDLGFSSICLLNYQKYTTFGFVNDLLNRISNSIQCVVSESNELLNREAFGSTQSPRLDTYADNIDTISFVSGL